MARTCNTRPTKKPSSTAWAARRSGRSTRSHPSNPSSDMETEDAPEEETVAVAAVSSCHRFRVAFQNALTVW